MFATFADRLTLHNFELSSRSVVPGINVLYFFNFKLNLYDYLTKNKMAHYVIIKHWTVNTEITQNCCKSHVNLLLCVPLSGEDYEIFSRLKDYHFIFVTCFFF